MSKLRYYTNYEEHRKKNNAQARRFYRANAEKCKKWQREYRKANPEIIKEQSRAYYKKNKAELSIKAKKHYRENAERIKARQRAYYRENREEIRAKNIEYYNKNREEILARKAKSKAETGRVRERFVLLDRDNFTCAYCGKSSLTSEIELELDHIIPVSEGGEDKAENLITSCKNCNRSKNKQLLNEKAQSTLINIVRERNNSIGLPNEKIIKLGRKMISIQKIT